MRSRIVESPLRVQLENVLMEGSCIGEAVLE